MFSCEYCETFKNSFFYRTPPVAAFVALRDTNWLFLLYCFVTRKCLQ